MPRQGFITIIMVLLIMAAMLSASFGVYAVIRHELRREYNKELSTQAYYTAESGIEDAVYRLVNEMNLPTSYNLQIDEASSTVSFSDVSTSTKRILSTGYYVDRYRSLMVNLDSETASSTDITLDVGASSGKGGFRLENTSYINGDILANGSITMANTATIVGDVQVALNSNLISGTASNKIEGNVAVHTCNGLEIPAPYLLYCVNSTCLPGPKACTSWSGEIASTAMPFTDEMVAQWKSAAEAGGTIGAQDIKNCTVYFGPVKINGDLIVKSCDVYITGTVWVTGNVDLQTGANVSLDTSYGSSSGVMISDGTMELGNGASAVGTSHPNSFMIMLSAYEDLNGSGGGGIDAVSIEQTFQGEIIAAPNGWVDVNQSTGVKHISAIGVSLRNGAGLDYDPNIRLFVIASGGGGTIASSSWSLYDWEEVE